jgi:hypothetical protein
MWARSLEEITAYDSTLDNLAGKRLGLSNRQSRAPAPYLSALWQSIRAEKSPLFEFSSRVEKVG